MPQALLIVGAILILLGLAGIVAGAPDWVLGLSLGDTLIQSGTIALVGGIVVIGMGLVLDALRKVLRRLEAAGRSASAQSQRHASEARAKAILAPPAPVAAPPTEPEPYAGEVPVDDDLPDFPADETFRSRREPAAKTAEEAPRARRERPDFELPLPRREAPFASDEQMRVRREQPNPVDDPGRSRRDRGVLSFPGDETRPPRESPLRRDDGTRARRELPAPSSPPPPPPLPMLPDDRRRPRYPVDGSAKVEPLPRFRPTAPSPAAGQPNTTVVRSGVIGGMAYTLYADGSIEAELPIGTVRFGSIAELQDHVLRTGAEADVDFKESAR
jgi:hypothetical protein